MRKRSPAGPTRPCCLTSRAFRRTRPVGTGSPSSSTTPPERAHRKLALAATLLLFAVGWAVWHQFRAPTPRAPAAASAMRKLEADSLLPEAAKPWRAIAPAQDGRRQLLALAA